MGDGDGDDILEGEGVLGGWNSLSSGVNNLVGEIFLGDTAEALNFFLTGGEICLGDFLGEDLRGDLILPAFGRLTGGGLGFV